LRLLRLQFGDHPGAGDSVERKEHERRARGKAACDGAALDLQRVEPGLSDVHFNRRPDFKIIGRCGLKLDIRVETAGVAAADADLMGSLRPIGDNVDAGARRERTDRLAVDPDIGGREPAISVGLRVCRKK
jgi:hypothetical protein